MKVVHQLKGRVGREQSTPTQKGEYTLEPPRQNRFQAADPDGTLWGDDYQTGPTSAEPMIRPVQHKHPPPINLAEPLFSTPSHQNIIFQLGFIP